MKKIIFSGLVLALALTASSKSAFAQRETETGVAVEKDILLLRRDLRADKKKLIAASVPLSPEEATRFWPVYDQYSQDMAKHNDEFYSLVKDYIANQKTLTDAQATDLLKRWSQVQVDQAQTRQKWVPLIEKVIPARKAALFFQIDRRIYALMDIQTSAELPLIIQ